MNLEIASDLSGYIKTLYLMNQNIIKMCGIDVLNDYEGSHCSIPNIIQDIPRIIPYFYNNDTKK